MPLATYTFDLKHKFYSENIVLDSYVTGIIGFIGTLIMVIILIIL